MELVWVNRIEELEDLKILLTKGLKVFFSQYLNNKMLAPLHPLLLHIHVKRLSLITLPISFSNSLEQIITFIEKCSAVNSEDMSSVLSKSLGGCLSTGVLTVQTVLLFALCCQFSSRQWCYRRGRTWASPCDCPRTSNQPWGKLDIAWKVIEPSFLLKIENMQ